VIRTGSRLLLLRRRDFFFVRGIEPLSSARELVIDPAMAALTGGLLVLEAESPKLQTCAMRCRLSLFL
jgi:hypothetical protein